MTARDDGAALADLTAAIEQLGETERERPGELDEQLRQLAERFAARHGFTASPGRAPRELASSLRFAIESGLMSAGQARDLDAFADGLEARRAAGELDYEQAIEIAGSTAIRDAHAVLRARARSAGNRAARRAEAAARRRARR